MSTPSTATATLPPHNPHYGYSHHQNYQPNPQSYRGNNSLLNPGSGRLAGTYNYPAASNNTPSGHFPPPVSSRASQASAQHPATVASSNPRIGSSAARTVSEMSSKKRNRSPDWKDFYKNGLPKEVIVIDDTPPPKSASVEAVAPPAARSQNGRAVAGSSRHTAKKRKRDDANPAYEQMPQSYSGHNSPQYHGGSSGSTISTDRTTSAIHTTAATSLGSQYSAVTLSNGTIGYADDDVQPGQKRKRTTRQQIANDAKRRELEIHGDAFHSYRPPPKPPIKAGEVVVKVMPDVSYTKNTKVDDDDGHYIVIPNSDLTDRYRVSKQLGQGTFGKVVQATDKKRGGYVAIKIIRSVQKYRDASRIELRVLSTLKANDAENRNRCIHLRDCFDYRGHICIVMDLLGSSVFDFLKSNAFVPFPNSQIQNFARQLFTSVAFLHDLNLIHTDLKPENILLCNSAYQTFTYNRRIPSSCSNTNRQAEQRRVLLDTEIRLIDFGSATFQDEYHSSVVSTRHYRAPEIILGLGWSFPCDIWSIGCILVEFYTGDALFQTHDNLEHLAMMEAVVDQKMPTKLVQQVNKMNARNNGNAAAKYFKRLKLDYPNTDTSRASRRFVKAMKKLEDIIPKNNAFMSEFLNLLRRIFVYDPAERITAKEALQHPWFREVAGPDDGTEAQKIRREREREREQAAREGTMGQYGY